MVEMKKPVIIQAISREEMRAMNADAIQVDSTNSYSGAREVSVFSNEVVLIDKSTPVRYTPGKAWGAFPGLTKLFTQLERNAEDLTFINRKLSDDFFKTNKRLIFSQKSAGGGPGFKDLTDATKDIKRERVENGGAAGVFQTAITGEDTITVYPILVKSGHLMQSLTTGNSKTVKIVNKKEFEVGTAEEHAGIHQAGTVKPSKLYFEVEVADTIKREDGTLPPEGTTRLISGLRRFTLPPRPPVQFKIGHRMENWVGAVSDALISIKGKRLA